MHELFLYGVAILAGVLAGFVNTLAGNGSAITLPVLMLMGLPADVANGTNRVGVLLASLVGASTFAKRGLLESKGIAWLLGPVVIGSIVGASVAGELGEHAMRIVILGAMVVMLVLLLVQPKRWLREDSEVQLNHKSPTTACSFFLIGMYGGFIQAGVGILLLSALVLKARYSLVKANAIKVLLVFIFTVAALIVFVWQGKVWWGYGLLMGSGQCFGAWIAARFAATRPNANVWIRKLLIVIIVVMLAKLAYEFGVGANHEVLSFND